MSAQTATRLNPNELTAHEVQTLESLAAEYSASPALHILVNMILAAKESGEPLEIFSHDKELSPNQAAQLIGMSRPFLLRFIRNGELKSHTVGTHQRIKLPDLLDFQERRVRAKAAHEEAVKAPAADPVLDLSDSELEELRLGFQVGEE